MTKIIGVRFKPVGKMYYFDPLGFDIKRGDSVVVETSRGTEYGEVIVGVKEVEDSALIKPLKGVLRLATDEDILRHKENKKKEKEAFKICLEKIEKHGLDMKLIEVEYTFDGNKILFYFTADGRVDFRELVKDLAAVFKTRIELRQIGVRDESKTLGSIGVCGRNLCCSQFLGEFVPVSIKMAKEQGLSLNPSKISGACGRLMCCLKYEQDTYEALMQEAPRQGAVVMTPDGMGTVTSVALLRGKVKVRLDSGDETTLKDFDVADVKPFDGSRPEPEEEIFTKEEKALIESLEALENNSEKAVNSEKRSSSQRRRNNKSRQGEENRNNNRPQKLRSEKKEQPGRTKERPEKTVKNDSDTKAAPLKTDAGKSEKKDKRNFYRNRNNRKKQQQPKGEKQQ